MAQRVSLPARSAQAEQRTPAGRAVKLYSCERKNIILSIKYIMIYCKL